MPAPAISGKRLCSFLRVIRTQIDGAVPRRDSPVLENWWKNESWSLTRYEVDMLCGVESSGQTKIWVSPLGVERALLPSTRFTPATSGDSLYSIVASLVSSSTFSLSIPYSGLQ